MDNTSRNWQVLPILVSIFAVLLPAYIAYDTLERGDSPPHKLEISETVRSEPTTSFSSLQERFKLTIDKKVIKHLTIVHFNIINTGKSPILPKEYFENLTVSAGENWTILGVTNEGSIPEGLSLSWNRIDDQAFSANPFLMNPGDLIRVAIYITNEAKDRKDKDEAKVTWRARIANLTNIRTEKVDYGFRLKMGAIIVYLSGPSLYFFIFAASVLVGLSILLYVKNKEIPGFSTKDLVFIVSLVMLAISTSEVLSYYFFEPISFNEASTYSAVKVLNISIILIQSLVLVFLSLALIKRKIPNN